MLVSRLLMVLVLGRGSVQKRHADNIAGQNFPKFTSGASEQGLCSAADDQYCSDVAGECAVGETALCVYDAGVWWREGGQEELDIA